MAQNSVSKVVYQQIQPALIERAPPFIMTPQPIQPEQQHRLAAIAKQRALVTPTWYDKFLDTLIGDDRNSKYALICQQCHSHNGLVLPDEFESTGTHAYARGP